MSDPSYNVRPGEQHTICDECGNMALAHDRAVWCDDGSCYCPPCARTAPTGTFPRLRAAIRRAMKERGDE